MNTELPWGLWCDKDRCWLGSKDGPFIYTQFNVALVAAEITGLQLGELVTARAYAPEVPLIRQSAVQCPFNGEQAIIALTQGVQ
jgi:hypothetical protein